MYALIGPIIGLTLFFGLGGMSQIGTTPITEIVFLISFVSYVAALPFLGICMYSKKEREIDSLLGDKTSVDFSTFDLLHAIDNTIEPKSDFLPKYDVNLSKQILLAEIQKAKEAGASSDLISGYLQRELHSWLEGTQRVEHDFKEFQQVIESV